MTCDECKIDIRKRKRFCSRHDEDITLCYDCRVLENKTDKALNEWGKYRRGKNFRGDYE